MKLKYFILFIFVSHLFIEIYSQRGGGRSSFGGMSRGFTRGSKNSKDKIYKYWWQPFLAFGLFEIGLIWIFRRYFKQIFPFLFNRKKLIENITSQYIKKNTQNSCFLTEQQMNDKINWFKKCNWIVKYKTKDGNQGQYCLTLKSLIKESDIVYKIDGKGEGEDIGDSKINGVLIFKGDNLGICFDKQYDDKKKAGQTGRWDILIYQGIQEEQQLRGEWYYDGFKNDQKYSGTMRMYSERMRQ